MAYATVDDFEDYLDGDPLPAHPDRLLDRASDRVDEMLVGAVYDGSDPEIVTKLRRITCIQAHFMAETGDETGAKAHFSSMSTGGVSWTRAQKAGGGTTVPRFSPDARSYARTSGLLDMIGLST